MGEALKIDTLAYATKLKDAGLKESHAHAIVEVFSSVDTSELATKTDIAELKTDLTSEIHKVARSNLFAIGAIVGLFLLLDKIWPILGIG